jgi:hypothetical protein
VKLPLSFSQALLRALTGDPEMKDTVGEWLRSEPDPEQRLHFFAVQLSEDFGHTYRIVVDPRDPDAWQHELHNTLIEMASTRVAWSVVARKLIRHFSTPAALTTPRNVRQLPAFAPPVERGGPSIN